MFLLPHGREVCFSGKQGYASRGQATGSLALSSWIFFLLPFCVQHYDEGMFIAEFILNIAEKTGLPPWLVGILMLAGVVGIVVLVWRKMQYMQ